MVILETERLLLRHLTSDDLDSLYALYCDPDITRYIPDAPCNYAEARQELEWHQHGHPLQPQLGLWATVHKASGQFIGRCGLLPWTIDGVDEVEVAYTIAQAFWGQGLATEAALAIRDYAFGQLGLSRLVCLIDEENRASVRVAEKMGMTFEKTCADEMGPFLLYAVTRKPSPENLLETARLILRRFTAEDGPHLFALDNDPAVMRYINGGTSTPWEIVQQQILPGFLRYDDATPGFGFWAAVEKATGDFVGWFVFRPTGGDPQAITLGYRFHKAAWGKGYATEGAAALIRKGFTEWGAQRVIATTYEENRASRRVMEKLGMRHVRSFRYNADEIVGSDTSYTESADVWPGEDVEYAITRAEWEARSSTFVKSRTSEIGFRLNPPIDSPALNELYRLSWPRHVERGDWPELAHSLAHIWAYAGERLVGFVYVAWDGGVHAFLLDPTVHPDFRRQGLGLALVKQAELAAKVGGCEWLHVDYEDHLDPFYRAAGFRPTLAGLIRLWG